MKKYTRDFMLIVIFIIAGVATRTVLHIAPNVEFVTGFTLASAFFLRKKYSIVVPLGIMAISDLIIGNSMIYLFTWSAFLLGSVFTHFIKIKNSTNILKIGLFGELSGIVFTLFFFLWTNLGVVVMSNMYSKDLSGVLLSYQMGLPFLLNQLIGNLIIVPSIFVITYIAYNFKLSIQEKILSVK